MSPPHDFYAHPNALVESEDIGTRTRIWAFATSCPAPGSARTATFVAASSWRARPWSATA